MAILYILRIARSRSTCKRPRAVSSSFRHSRFLTVLIDSVLTDAVSCDNVSGKPRFPPDKNALIVDAVFLTCLLARLNAR
nr:MAG TPA: hypothetical protein [Caudoviricetes sp.]